MTPMTTKKIFASSPIPNQTITSGSKARCGTFRIIRIVVSKKANDLSKSPLIIPSTKPINPPIIMPTTARLRLAKICLVNSPLTIKSHPVVKIEIGDGNKDADTIWSLTTTSQIIINAMVSIQGRISNKPLFIFLPPRIIQSFHIFFQIHLFFLELNQFQHIYLLAFVELLQFQVLF